MLLTYDALNAGDLGEVTPADVLIRLDARFEVVDDRRLIFSDPSFPVVELARELRAWLERNGRSDFEFQSMSFEERGSLSIRETCEGWVFGSVFEPLHLSTPVSREAVEACISVFVERVAADLVALGLDPLVLS